ncbi:hypothetical protein ABT247_32085 [Kitasatospora sp. NPDC001539]|uniref:hypothetical protein n=1 Tax=Kitasatospora sp. NPDC001539 TaxID=3154384 RepID=UPI00333077DA
MRANHATKPLEPVRRGIAGAGRALARWLPRPGTVAAGGALLAQLWGVGAPGAYAAPVEPPRGQTQPAVRGALRGGPVIDGQSAVRPPAPAPTSIPPSASTSGSPGLAGELTGVAPVGGAGGGIGGVLQQRIRDGGLPLPGQQAAVPDAFALASGLLASAPAQDPPAEGRASRAGEPAEPPTDAQPGDRRAVTQPGSGTADAPPVQEAAVHEEQDAVEPADAAGAAAPATSSASSGEPATPAEGGQPETLALADTSTETAVDDGSATATAVLAPIAAGLLLTGAAMFKHRGLPRGH